MPKKAIIIGAGPAGLTAAYELLKRTDIKPILIEKCNQVGGISKTVDYKGNKMDFGPHRFFSKSDRVMNWWTNIMPLHTPKGEDLTISYQNKSRTINTGDFLTADESDGLPPANSMLVIPRLTRIYFLRQFFAYPIQLSIATLGQLGLGTTIKIVFSYLYARLFPRKPEKSLEDFMINKFGSVLYHIFFKDYTEKVWGMDCNKISAEWGAQRIKGVSLSKAVIHAAKALTKKKKKVDKTDINQKDTETSLIEQFLYPAKGAGAIWEEVARQVEVMGGKIVSNYDVKQIFTDGDQITGIEALNTLTGQLESLEGDYFISTMPIQELIAGLKGNVPEEVKEVAAGLVYRDFVYAGVLVKKMSIPTPKDSWIYIQERDVTVARMQIYNNWGPYMVADPNTVWLGLEYFCTKGDAIWSLTDEEVERKAVEELVKMNLVSAEDVLDTKVNRMEKTYPAYFGTYDRFDVIRNYLDNFSNLFLVGRNGMHKYNNADHSMLTAMVAVDNITEGVLSKDNLWSINTEQEYHEEKREVVEEKAITSASESIPKTPLKLVLKYWGGKTFHNKLWLLLSAMSFIVFKALYPHPHFIHGDSFVYMESAYHNLSINTFPIGYPIFLRMISGVSKWDMLLIGIQYGILQWAFFYLATKVFKLSNASYRVKTMTIIFLAVNPLLLYTANLVSSDALFISITAIWFAQLLQLSSQPTTRLLIIHGVILYFAFITRYNALYYPIISLLIILFSQLKWKAKIGGIFLPLGLIACFIIFTSNEYLKLTKIRQFSPFSGWQLANNALGAYLKSDSISTSEVPKKLQELHRFTNDYYIKSKETGKFPYEKDYATTVYMWSQGTPLQDYMALKTKQDSTASAFKRWAMQGQIMKEYGNYLISKKKKEYVKYFLAPNFIKYFTPPEEFLEHSASGRDSVSIIAQSWFGYSSSKIVNNVSVSNKPVIAFYSILSGIINALFPTCVFFYFVLFKLSAKPINKLLFITSILWLFNMAFSVLAAPVNLRYQIFTIHLTFIISSLIIEKIFNEAFSKNTSLSKNIKLAN